AEGGVARGATQDLKGAGHLGLGAYDRAHQGRPADPAVVKALVEGIDAPLNVMVGPWMPAGVPELAALGVARVSAGAVVAQAAHALVRRAARELLGTGTYETLADGLDYGELNSLIGGGR
ncbi:isocitrate lyase/phosphoenolpyruvate mutase family protein, partial [Streptomyces sp. NPDC005568]|uniref:isocitrate lyase/phosphoenolpyruvate mutase family protein n=1 Tax=Streptomyces sp. NPDC005568 TaxID=3156887 RepID=UPI0033B94D1F